MEFLKNLKEANIEKFLLIIPKIAITLLSLYIGLKLINLLIRGLKKGFKKRDFDPSLTSFLISFVKTFLQIALFISIISYLGFKTTSFITILGSAGLAIGLALQGSLSHFAGGIMLLIYKPFKVGDTIEACGHIGTIEKLTVFNTILNTPDNSKVIIPNGPLSSGTIKNYAGNDTRRADMLFGVSYDSDLNKTQNLIQEIVMNHPKILKDPVMYIGVSELAASSVNFMVRFWVNRADLLAVQHEVNKLVKESLDENGINIPFQTQELHIKNI